MGSLPLGISSKQQYEGWQVELGLGDMLVFHTDGLVEACNAQDEMLGYDRMAEFVLELGRDSVSSVEGISRMMAGAHGFMGNREHEDDITLVVAKVT